MITATCSLSRNAKSSARNTMSVISRVAAIVVLLSLAQLPLFAKGLRQQHAPSEKHTKPKKIKEFSNWPSGTSPQEIGKRVAERYLAFTYLNLRRNPPSARLQYRA